MKNIKYFATFSAFIVTILGCFSSRIIAAEKLKVTCEAQNSVPKVIVTLFNRESTQSTPILSFLPEYFSSDVALTNCQSTAEKLHTFYSQGQMNYLASDTVGQKPVICAVARRGMSCEAYNSEILFSSVQAVNPTEFLYNMLGSDFKGSNIPSSRTVSRIYTDLTPSWWPFSQF